MENKKCDLHIHSNFSDSDADVESIFKQADEKQLSCISITDHDTVSSIYLAREYSKIYNIEIIEGVEFSARHKDGEVHILAYFIDTENSNLCEKLKIIKNVRIKRFSSMIGKLNDLGLRVDEQELMLSIGESIPSRLHLGLYLVKKGLVPSMSQVFGKYLGIGKPAYEAGFKFLVEDIVDLVKECGGVSFLAHPHILPNQDWVTEIINLGVDGLEIAYHNMSLVKKLLYQNMVSKKGLLRCGGSDVHGSYKEFIKMGDITIPYKWVREMKHRLGK